MSSKTKARVAYVLLTDEETQGAVYTDLDELVDDFGGELESLDGNVFEVQLTKRGSIVETAPTFEAIK